VMPAVNANAADRIQMILFTPVEEF
jgi:hypothetical protein